MINIKQKMNMRVAYVLRVIIVHFANFITYT